VPVARKNKTYLKPQIPLHVDEDVRNPVRRVVAQVGNELSEKCKLALGVW
jgi:hypothetical protein